MIKTQELQMQIDELTKQNDMMLSELEQMKRLISGNQSNSSGQGQNQNASGSFGGQQQGDQQQQNQGQRQSNGRAANLANDLLQIKEMVAKLEQKTSQYVSSQSNGSLTDKDVVNLVLTLINGMVDWASDFVSSQASSSSSNQ